MASLALASLFLSTMPSLHEKPPATAGAESLPAKVYQAVWRWHFWAGLLVSPILIVVSITGAIYVFKAELERMMYPELMFTENVSHSQTGFDAFQAAIQEVDPDRELRFVNVSANPARAWEGFAEIRLPDGTEEIRRYYFDPGERELTGSLDNKTSFFRVVLAIHRRLLADTPGRIVVEAATCWGVISILAGLYLWWPRKKGKVWGVWIPRVRGSFRSVLRDWHTVPGVYISVFVLSIMITGLLFTKIWGTSFRAGVFLSGGFPDFFVSPPKSVLPEGVENPSSLSIDEAVSTAFGHFDFSKEGYSVGIPHAESDEPYSIITLTSVPLADRGAVFVDQYSGETLVFETDEDLPWQTHVVLAFYPIHTGSIFGLPTKILAVVSCLLIIAMSVTGVWMWWRRRPPGKWGAPRKPPAGTVPNWLAWTTVALAVFLPTVGLTLVAIFLIDWIARKTSKPIGGSIE